MLYLAMVIYMYCCFTGHRPEHLGQIADESSEKCKKLKSALSEAIDKAISDGYTDFYCGMARGIDTYAGEILINKIKHNKNLHIHAALPCPDQYIGWSERDIARFEYILKNSATKTVISPMYTDSCMLTRNRFMVDNSRRVIAVWNGFFRGGTAYTVRYAKKEKKEIYLIRPKDLSVTVL